MDINTFTIDEGAMQWAIEVATWNAQTFISKVKDHIADNFYEAELKKVLNIIKTFGDEGCVKRDLTRKTQHLDRRKRSDI